MKKLVLAAAVTMSLIGGAGSVWAQDASSGKVELDVNAGVALDSSQFGFGGGLAGYLPLSSNFKLGVSADFYTFSEGASASVSGDGETETVSASANVNFIEVLARAKYVFEGTNLKPYLFGGVGIADVNESGSGTGTSSGGGSATATTSGSQVDPMIAIGGGLEFPAGKDFAITVQLKESLVFVPSQTVTEDVDGSTISVSGGGGTESYTVLEGGLDFDL